MVALKNPLESFVWGEGGAALTPEQIASRRRVEDALRGKVDTSPVDHWTQGLARVADALVGSVRRGQLDNAQAESNATGAADYAAAMKAFGGGTPATTPTTAPVSASSVPMTSAASEVAATSPKVASAGVSSFPDATELNAYLSDEARRATLPAGMRNNNPGNIKFVGQKVPGIVGPSVNTDQGDPQAVFDTPESGMRAMHSLLLKKYNGGKLTPNQIIAGDMGWTPGNLQAAANVAKYAGIGPDDDIGLTDPNRAAKFMRGLMMQEHGKSSGLYPDSMILSALGGQPTQVASLDPSAGMPPAAAAIQAAAPASGYVDPAVSVQSRTEKAELPPLAAPQTVSPTPAIAQVAQQLAQAPQAQQQSPMINEAILRAMSSPHMSEGQRNVVQMLMQTQMKQQQDAQDEQKWRTRQTWTQDQQRSDPSNQLDMEVNRAQLDALRGKPTKTWQKLDDTTLFNPETGETQRVGAPAGNGQFRFDGKSVEAQALNGLMEAGQLTPDQAQQLGAGKTITGPNGEIIFMTPQGVFGQSSNGAFSQMTPQASTPGGVDIFADVPAQAKPTGVVQQSQAPQRQGMIPLTQPKVTVDESKAAGFADRMTEQERILSDVSGAPTGWAGTFGNMVSDNDYIPDAFESSLMTGDFQRYDTARRNFINAQMRRESGAVIGKDEFANANKQYFPMPGDDEATLRDKAQARKTVIDAMRRDAGPTYKTRGGSPELDAARDAIARGAPKDAVIKRLRENGINPEGL